MKERNSVTKETAERYRHSDKKTKKDILNEYIHLTGFHRKYAIAKLNSCIKKWEHNFNNCIIQTTKVEIPKRKLRIYKPKYGIDVVNSLTRIWQTFDYICGQCLVPFIRENIEALAAEPYFQISSKVCSKLLQISSATVNRALKGEWQKNRIHGTCTTKAAGNLNKLIPIRVYFDWDDRNLGFFEMDTVAHDGGRAYGEYCYTLTFTDVCTGWTVLYALLNKAHRRVKESAEDLKVKLPYALKVLILITVENSKITRWSNGVTKTKSLLRVTVPTRKITTASLNRKTTAMSVTLSDTSAMKVKPARLPCEIFMISGIFS